LLFDRDGRSVGTAPANAAQQQRVYDLARALRLLSAPKLLALTGNNVGFFNNYTLLETVRRRYLEGEGADVFSKRGRVMQIPFFVNDDEKSFAEAFFFNFSPKGVQLGDFHPEGKTSFRTLIEVETSVKYLRSFWELVYETSDDEGPLGVGTVWEPLLHKLDSSLLLVILSADYIGEVINRALRSLAAELDAVLPGGVVRSSREWWAVIRAKLNSLVFSQENELMFKRFMSNERSQRGDKAVAVVTPAKPVYAVGGSGSSKSSEICFAAMRHHYDAPAGSSKCGKPGCMRVHPEGYKKLSLEEVLSQVQMMSKGDPKELASKVKEDKASFLA
jgi:hypothetical protein